MATLAEKWLEIDPSGVQYKIYCLLSENFTRKKDIKKIIRSVLSKARRNVRSDAKSLFSNDPRGAYKAVRMVAYKSILGGNINILTSRKGSGTSQNWVKQRTLHPGQRGGNRRSRSARTEQIDNYIGASRGFILRFQNSGTDERDTRYGYRGRISARDWFGPSAQANIQAASNELSELLDRAAQEVWNEG